MRPRERIEAPTLGYLANQVAGVRCLCLACRRYAVLPLGPLMERCGADLPFPELHPRLRCSACRSSAIEASPDWPPVHGTITRGGASAQGWS